jgi:hypothetical protein
MLGALVLAGAAAAAAERDSDTVLENAAMRLEFDREAGGLRSVTNKLTGETYAVRGDAFSVETTALTRAQKEMRQVQWTATAQTVTAYYSNAEVIVDVAYELRPADHFFQKRLGVTFAVDSGVKQITVSRPVVTLTGLDIVCFRHPDFDWLIDYHQAKHGSRCSRPEGSEPSRTFFGRTTKGGFFVGLEMPYDNSRHDRGELILGFAPSLKIKAGERLACEPMVRTR